MGAGEREARSPPPGAPEKVYSGPVGGGSGGGVLGEAHRARAESSELWEEIRKTGEEWSGIGCVGEDLGCWGGIWGAG